MTIEDYSFISLFDEVEIPEIYGVEVNEFCFRNVETVSSFHLMPIAEEFQTSRNNCPVFQPVFLGFQLHE